MKKFVTWNVNGIRACVKKGFEESFAALDADIFALQETKMQEGQLDLDLAGPRPSRLPPVLELCRKEGLLRHGGLRERGAALGHPRHRQSGARL